MLDIDIYDVTVHWFLGSDADTLIKTFVERGGAQGKKLELSRDDRSDIISGFKDEDQGFVLAPAASPGHIIIWLEVFNGDAKSTGLLVHEATHVAIAIFDRINSRINEETEEHFCHLLQHLSCKLIERYAGKNGDNNTNGKEGYVQELVNVPEPNSKIKRAN